jgi:hypothetical protein
MIMTAPSLGRDIAWALLLKLVLLTLIYLLFFRADVRPAIDTQQLFAPTSSALAPEAPQ